jgi:hypothetical protein
MLVKSQMTAVREFNKGSVTLKKKSSYLEMKKAMTSVGNSARILGIDRPVNTKLKREISAAQLDLKELKWYGDPLINCSPRKER